VIQLVLDVALFFGRLRGVLRLGRRIVLLFHASTPKRRGFSGMGLQFDRPPNLWTALGALRWRPVHLRRPCGGTCVATSLVPEPLA
jgi:hypothetical protein